MVLLTKLRRIRQCRDQARAFDKTYSQSINIFLARNNLHTLQAFQEIQFFPYLRGIALDTKGEEAGSTATAESEHAESLPLEFGGLNSRKQRGEAAVEGRSVHVTQPFRAVHGRLDHLSVEPLGSRNEGLLEVLVSYRVFVWHSEDGLWRGDVGELGRRWGCNEIVVEETTECLLDLFAIWTVEDGVVDIVQ